MKLNTMTVGQLVQVAKRYGIAVESRFMGDKEVITKVTHTGQLSCKGGGIFDYLKRSY